jgi:hypothetical protein
MKTRREIIALLITGAICGSRIAGMAGGSQGGCAHRSAIDSTIDGASDQLSEPTAVQIGALGDVAPVHDRDAKLLIAPVDFLGNIVFGAG